MLLLLALIGCGDPATTPSSDVTTVGTETGPPPGPHTAIAPDYIAELDEPAELPVPEGQALVNDACFRVSRPKPAPRPMSRPMSKSAAPRGGGGDGFNGNGLSGIGGIGTKGSGGSATGYGAGAGSMGRASEGAAASDADIGGGPPPPPPPAETTTRAAPNNDPKPMPGVLDESVVAEAEPADAGDDAPELAKNVKQAITDWGATIWLSNDDSMSLASAQRVLYSLKRSLKLKVSEIRPHELLNYFTFETQKPADGELFGVAGEAVQEGDTLTMALAVQGAMPPRQPLDLTLLVDRSCSMRAEDRMGFTQDGLILLSDEVRKGDRIDLVLFDSGVCTPLEDYVVGRDDPKLFTDTVRKIKPTSSTNLDAGLKEAWRIQKGRESEGRNKRVVLITDANLNAGNVDKDLVSEVGKRFDEDGIRLSGIGVGLNFNDEMLDKLTEKGKGAYVYLGSDAVVERVFGPGFDSLTRTIAHDVRFALDLPDSLALERFYGEEASTDPTEVQPINYYAGTSQVFLQDLKVKPGGTSPYDPVALEIHWKDTQTGEDRLHRWETSIGALTDTKGNNVRKAQALMAFTDVALEKAMTGNCGSALGTYQQRLMDVSGDPEIDYVNGLLTTACGTSVGAGTTAASGVAYKVKVDADETIKEVSLVCSGQRRTKPLAGNVASFQLPPGQCSVGLLGNIEHSTTVTVPKTGGSVRCMLRGGKLNCS